MSVAFILNPGYNTINNVHHTFWDQQGDAIANSSLTQALEVETSVSAPSHVITGGTDPAQFYMLDATTLATDAPIFKAPVLQAPTAFSDLVGEFTTDGGVSFQNDIHMTYDAFAHDIDGVGTLTCDTLKYTTLDPAVTPGNPSTWSSYPALSNVNLSNNKLLNTESNTVEIRTEILQVSNAAMGAASAPTQVLVYSQSDNAETTAQLRLYAGNSTIAIGTLTQCPTTAAGGEFPEYSSFGSDSAALRLAGSAGDIAIMPCNQFQPNTGKIRLCYNQGLAALTLNQAGAVSFNSDWASGVPVDGSFGTAGQIIQSNGSSAPPSWVAATSASDWANFDAITTVKMAGNGITNCLIIGSGTVETSTLIGPAGGDIDAQETLIKNLKTDSASNVFYVAKNGVNTARAGSVTFPLDNITSAVDMASALYPQQCVIMIAPGVYTENIIIGYPNVTLVGYAPSANQNKLTQIVGDISIMCSVSQDLYFSQIGLFNLQVSGSIIDTSSAVHSLNIEQCRISGEGRLVWQNSSANNRTRLERVVLLHGDVGAGTDPLLCFSSGMATLNLLDITAKDNAPVLQFDGTATLNTCTLCNFTSTTTSATAAPIVYIAIANGGSVPLSQKGFAFAYCAFTYSSPVARAFSTGKNCGIVTDSITGNVNLIITYNAFNLLLCDATCFVVSDINKNTPSKASTVRFFSNLSTYLATGIDTLVGNKTTFAAVA